MGISLRCPGKLRILLGDPMAADSSDGGEPQEIMPLSLQRIPSKQVLPCQQQAYSRLEAQAQELSFLGFLFAVG